MALKSLAYNSQVTRAQAQEGGHVPIPRAAVPSLCQLWVHHPGLPPLHKSEALRMGWSLATTPVSLGQRCGAWVTPWALAPQSGPVAGGRLECPPWEPPGFAGSHWAALCVANSAQGTWDGGGWPRTPEQY